MCRTYQCANLFSVPNGTNVSFLDWSLWASSQCAHTEWLLFVVLTVGNLAAASVRFWPPNPVD
jgi:hypothetical protein